MENIKKIFFETRKELFVSMINKLNDIQIKHIAYLLKVNPQSCLEYLHHYKADLNKKSKENPVHEEDRDWRELYHNTIQHDNTTGFCKVVNLTNPSFPYLSYYDLFKIMNLEKFPNEQQKKMKPKLINILAQYLFKPIHEDLSNSTTKAKKYWSYHDTVSVINECLTEQVMMQVEGGCYETSTKQQVLISQNKILSPVFFDADKSILYAYILDLSIKYRDLNELNIHPIYINSIYEATIFNAYELIEPSDITDIRRINHKRIDERSIFIDIFGSISVGARKQHDIVIHLNYVAKAKLLSKSTLFSSYIKLNNKASKTDFPFTLKIKLIRLDELADFIFANSQHIMLDVSASVKRALKSELRIRVKNTKALLGYNN